MSEAGEELSEAEPVREGDADGGGSTVAALPDDDTAVEQRKRKIPEADRPPLRSLPARGGKVGQEAPSSPGKAKRQRTGADDVKEGAERRKSGDGAAGAGRGRGGARRPRQPEESKMNGQPNAQAERQSTKSAAKAEDDMETESEQEGGLDDGKKAAAAGQEGVKEERPKRVRKRQVEGAGEDDDETEDEGSEAGAAGGGGGKQEAQAKGAKKGGVVTSTVDDKDVVPRSLDLLEDKVQKGIRFGPVMYVKDPDNFKHFEWVHGKWFIVAAYTSEGQRIRGPLLHQTKVRYRISYSADSDKPTSEVLYDDQGDGTKGSLFFFHVPQFKITGHYTIHFTLESPRFRRVEGFKQSVRVEMPPPPPPKAGEETGKPLASATTAAAPAAAVDVEPPEPPTVPTQGGGKGKKEKVEKGGDKGKGKEKEEAGKAAARRGGGQKKGQETGAGAKEGGGGGEGGGRRAKASAKEEDDEVVLVREGKRKRDKEEKESKKKDDKAQGKEKTDKDGPKDKDDKAKKPTKPRGGRADKAKAEVEEEEGGGKSGKAARRAKPHKEEEGEEDEDMVVVVVEDDEEEGEGGGGGMPPAFDEIVQQGPAFSLTLPGTLHGQLVEEWFNITRKRRLVPLPRKPCVGDILRSFEKEQIGWSPRKGSNAKALTVQTDRLCSLFDGALGSVVLYRFEKEQYVQQLEIQVRKKQRQLRPHQIWGAEHLLRFIVMLPRLLVPLPPPPPHEEHARKTKSTRAGSSSQEKDKDKEGERESHPEVVRQDLERTGAFLQALLRHLEERREDLFAETVEPDEGYGIDVPRVQLKHG